MLAKTVLNDLPKLLTDARERRDLTYPQAAEEIGVATSTVYKMERGKVMRGDILVKVLAWMAVQK